jgi:crotonobetainyl-CoA:carnitine CoA-transferase CaiB-like acyl-CoA transferase
MALLDVQVATLANQAMNFLASGVSPQRRGNSHPNIVPYQAFQTADGHIILAIGNDAQFERFCRLSGRDELAIDARFCSNSDRVKYRDVLVPQVAAIMLQKSSADWLVALNAEGIPCGPINDIEQVFADPQVQHRGLQMELDHPDAGKVASVANPIKMSLTPVQYDRAPPLLGQHTGEVLTRLLGLDAQEVSRLQQDNIIA